ncbi:MAG: pyrroline-5-carboxylate reductase [Candidatus Heteroscillospira sp.]|jgi:pyrroline-5-carboxylate reductase
MYRNIGFIGCGNMGSALARAVIKGGGGERIILANRRLEKAEALAKELGCAVSDNAGVAEDCGLIFLGVKPQIMPGVLAEIAPVLRERRDRFVLVTMAAGLTMDTIRAMAGGDYPVIRIMPNTPVAIGAGVVQMCAVGVTEEEQAAFRELLRCAGLVDSLPESLIDAASAVSGCGTAYMCLFMEALADGGVACGLPRDKALSYAAQTMLGMGRMYLESGEHPGSMKDKVCSPGGTTIQGVRALENGGVRAACMEAVIAAYDKTRELKQGGK